MHYLHANHNEGAGKQAIEMNYIWVICVLASCLMLKNHLTILIL